jgi:hypothetical protein
LKIAFVREQIVRTKRAVGFRQFAR